MAEGDQLVESVLLAELAAARGALHDIVAAAPVGIEGDGTTCVDAGLHELAAIPRQLRRVVAAVAAIGPAIAPCGSPSSGKSFGADASAEPVPLSPLPGVLAAPGTAPPERLCGPTHMTFVIMLLVAICPFCGCGGNLAAAAAMRRLTGMAERRAAQQTRFEAWAD